MNDRIELWDSLTYLASDMTTPWLVGGDFNVVVDEEEKYGGLPVSVAEVEDFRCCIQSCNLTDLGYKGSIFTWWNGRGRDDCIFKRLDRCLGSFELQETYPGLEVSHLIKNGSDHSPMLLDFNREVPQFRKSFKFLNFWTKHESFMDMIKENWNIEVEGNSFWRFNTRLKNMRKMLFAWSRSTYGDFFQKVKNMEEVVKAHEAMFKANPSFVHREKLMKVNAEYTQVLAVKEEYWKQKSDQNQMLVKMPCKQKVNEVVFGLNPTSAGGPDGYTGFVKGRSIVENILLAQEIISDMRMRTKKAYDRLSWGFLTTVMRKMGFAEKFIGHIWELVANNWALNSLHHDPGFCGFGLTKWSLRINHLCYAYDTIIFASACEMSLGMIMKVLANYETASGQLINRGKSVVYLHDKVDESWFVRVEWITGINRQAFPIIYLGCPIYYSKAKMSFYSELLKIIRDKLQGWKGRMLSFGGKAVLLKHVLQAMPMHLLSAMYTPSFVVEKLYKIFAQFFWSNSEGERRRH
ncbi:uncharacterized protein LOC132639209 [Lycium barbarum]|uniref:uncharacterized protein LOC132639209 n=1 Tax=Lycium barbarum TaxID=112863 RepID=UPI00293F430A|nr:uncharacterized protein LOC132639209 [Lycium barbarum]